MTQATITDRGRIQAALKSFTTRRVRFENAVQLRTGDLVPRAGDLVLARISAMGQHTGLQLHSGRRASTHVGSEIIVCYGNRYAPDQFEAVVPTSLGPCHLAAAGGIAGTVLCKHRRMKPATELEPIGLVADANGKVLNVKDYGLSEPVFAELPPVFVVCGTSMNAGKTASAAALIRGLTNAGYRVGAAKITGTGAAGDLFTFADAGAHAVLDFTDAGLASTYMVDLPELERAYRVLTHSLVQQGANAIVIEIADGIHQRETAVFLRESQIMKGVTGVVFAAYDASGATAGASWLSAQGHAVLAISGQVTSSPLAMREAEEMTGLMLLGLDELSDPAITGRLCVPATSRRLAREAA